jgi:hypothetical protein
LVDPRAPRQPPGSRAPHMMIRQPGGPVAVHDLVGTRFLLLVGAEGQAWESAAAPTARDVQLDLRSVRLQPDDHAAQARLREAYGVEPQGAVLIRPDGIIAWRAEQGPTFPLGELSVAVQRVLGR